MTRTCSALPTTLLAALLSACGPATPSPDLATVTITHCASDADCHALLATPFCSGGVCVSCSNDTQCPAPLHCDPTIDSGRGACFSCVTSAHCPAGQMCVNNACAGGECGTFRACPTSGATCVITNGVGRCVECSVDSDCGSPGYVCTANHCVVGCRSSAGCPSKTSACAPLDGGSRCVECMQDSDCSKFSGNLVCSPATFNCVNCVDDRQCSGGYRCFTAAGSCVQCLTDTDCGGGQRCLIGPYYCAPDNCDLNAGVCNLGTPIDLGTLEFD